jgi:hypothetical protein
MSTLLTAEIRPVTRTMVLDPPLSDAELEAMCRAVRSRLRYRGW